MTEEQETQSPKKRMGRPPKAKQESTGIEYAQDVTPEKRILTIPRLTFDELKARGLPVKKAVFHNAVTSWQNTPEFAFHSPDPKDPVQKSRVAHMWYVDNVGLIWEYKGKQGLVQVTKDIRFV